MPSLYKEELHHTEEMQDIITAPPSWLLRWGISVFFSVLLLIITLSSVIRYPDIIKTQMEIKSNNPPVIVAGTMTGRMANILVRNNERVKKDMALANYESAGNDKDINSLLRDLKKKRLELLNGDKSSGGFFNDVSKLKLGELEDGFRNFYLSYLIYKISISEKGISADQATIQKLKFIHSLDDCIKEIYDWKNRYIMISPISGQVSFAGVIENGQRISPGQELFYINPDHPSFFGTVSISQNLIGKVRIGQRVLIKLRSYPYEEFGALEGKIQSIGNVIYKNGVYTSQVRIFENEKSKQKGVQLRNGMIADAEIITVEASVFKRITRSLIKIFR
jgi:multidrug efflux pump subunit AcrA (membrane-fusion protein)